MTTLSAESPSGLVKKISRKNYRPLPVSVPKIDLCFTFEGDAVTVDATITLLLKASEKSFLEFHQATPREVLLKDGLMLNGSSYLSLKDLFLHSSKLSSDLFKIVDNNLWILPEAFERMQNDEWELKIIVQIEPCKNSELSGLYKSNGNFVTQCEAEGFRNITYSFDRPDVMSIYSTRIVAARSALPTLLGNGNLTALGECTEKPGYHFVQWNDPFPKPSYLFAIVAGDFRMIQDSFTTIHGRKVQLHFYSEEKYIDKLDHAMASLKKAMKWDEDKFGREYDLELFNVVAIDDFNAGAMENKSLNIFNSSLIVAGNRTATDSDFERIEGVVAHEYFHNWTGNRVTCRDWFQLTLKEGLTVYRDQEFSSDMNSRPVVRLQNVAFLRSRQFPEDQGTMRHPIRPDEYESIDNFYTYTVYEKGAEVVRMYEFLYGKDGFRKGMDLYFERHDGNAVTCDDFLQAMADANSDNLEQFSRWYHTAGTPLVTLEGEYDTKKDLYFLQVKQIHESPNAEKIDPLVIPIKIAFLNPTTGSLLRMHSYFTSERASLSADLSECTEYTVESTETVLRLVASTQTFVFPGFQAQVGNLTKPILSPFRGFSAPVKSEILNASPKDAVFVLAHDTDGLNRFNAGQTLTRWLANELYTKARDFFHSKRGESAEYDFRDNVCSSDVLDAIMIEQDSKLKRYFENYIVKGFQAVLDDSYADDRLKAYTVAFPSITELCSDINSCDPVLLHVVLLYLNTNLANRLEGKLRQIIQSETLGASISQIAPSEGSARRTLMNKAYSLIALLKDGAMEERLLQRMRVAQNMTDEISSLNALNYECTIREIAMREFQEKWHTDSLTMHKWYLLNASCNIPGNFATVEKIYRSDSFVKTNPNNIYTLLGGLKNSFVNFHSPDYKGYSYLVNKVIEMDKINPAVAARLMSPFTLAKSYTKGRQSAICALMSVVTQSHCISKQVSEIANATIRALRQSNS